MFTTYLWYKARRIFDLFRIYRLDGSDNFILCNNIYVSVYISGCFLGSVIWDTWRYNFNFYIEVLIMVIVFMRDMFKVGVYFGY